MKEKKGKLVDYYSNLFSKLFRNLGLQAYFVFSVLVIFSKIFFFSFLGLRAYFVFRVLVIFSILGGFKNGRFKTVLL